MKAQPLSFFHNIGFCDSCRRPSLSLRKQTNFGIERRMCLRCRQAAWQVEYRMSPTARNRAEEARLRWIRGETGHD